jgi:hypothetical protein
MPIADRLLPPLFGVHVFLFSSSHWLVTMVLIPPRTISQSGPHIDALTSAGPGR